MRYVSCVPFYILHRFNLRFLGREITLGKGSLTQANFVAQPIAIFVALKLQLQNRACTPSAISVRFYCSLSPRFEMKPTNTVTMRGSFTFLTGIQLLFTKSTCTEVLH